MKLPCVFTVLLCVVGFSGSSAPPPRPMRAKGAAPEAAPEPPAPLKTETADPTHRAAKGDDEKESARARIAGEEGRSGAPRGSALVSLVLGRRPCAELCAAGLGGSACGRKCFIQLPASIIKLLHSTPEHQQKPNITIKSRPRYEVCTELCDNNLGEPICSCPVKSTKTTQWSTVCQAFCKHGSYRLDGCPKCKTTTVDDPNDSTLIDAYMFNQDFWMEWCQYQCSNGDGGAACNCDLPPLMLNID